jgi:dienelactone hydrolase
MLGAYGPWAASIIGAEPARLSFRRAEWTDLEPWRATARQRLLDLLAQPETGGLPPVSVQWQYCYDDLDIEELSWQLPYGPPTEAVFLKPAQAAGKLPGILALHDHAANKFFGWRKIARTAKEPHLLMAEHQAEYYGGTAWANEVAKRGYAVLVHDVFPFASRRILLQDVPEEIRPSLASDGSRLGDIFGYNTWAKEHEHIVAKSLFCTGTTWPGLFLAEDQRALDVLCSRPEVDVERVGCAGLSGGGLRTVFLGGVDLRIRCAVCVGMLTTWRDYLLHKSHTHTWMVYVPLLPRDLDYPEILGLRVPLPTLVLNDSEDELFTLPEMERAATILQEVYHKAGAGDRYHCTFYPGPHKFDRAMQTEAFAWFDRWLK